MENGFLELYNYCQTLEPVISRKILRLKVKEIKGTTPQCIKTSMDQNTSRGFFVTADNTNSPFAQVAQSYGNNVIVLARDLNKCWERFVYTKELMHVFDDRNESVNTPKKFEELLNSFEVLTNDQDYINSEVVAFWRALSCLCPEKNRQEFIESYNKGHIDFYGIALRLRIPAQYVPSLFHERFLERAKAIRN